MCARTFNAFFKFFRNFKVYLYISFVICPLTQMIVQNFEIRLENRTSNVYHSGDTINGFVLLVISEPLEIKGVQLEISGTGHTQWKETRTISQTDISAQINTKILQDTCRGDEEYISYRNILWDKWKPSGNHTSVVLQPGSYEFRFTFLIPNACPSSFEGLNGFVRYVCRAFVSDSRITTFKCKQAFTVINTVDLNKETVAQRPINDRVTKSIRSKLFEAAGTLECSMELSRCGFVPGEVVHFTFMLNNQTSATIDKLEAKLEEIVIYKGKYQKCTLRNLVDRTYCTTRTVTRITNTGVPPKDSLVWNKEGLLIPAIAPTLKNCGVIESYYELHFKAFEKNGNPVIDLCFPVIIGTVPLLESVEFVRKTVFVQPLMASPREKSSDDVQEMSPIRHQDFTSLPPPTYQLGHFSCTNIKDSGVVKSTPVSVKRTPRYPYYDYLSRVTTSTVVHSLKYES